MEVVHFLDVGQGDCSIIGHQSGRITMIDVCNARSLTSEIFGQLLDNKSMIADQNYENPISYLKKFGVNKIFRFIATHPDMDHIDGIADIFSEFRPQNFWHTRTNKVIESHSLRFRKRDWDTYRHLCNGTSEESYFSRSLELYSGFKGPYYNQLDSTGGQCDNLDILSPTPELIRMANQTEKYNDASYVILFRSRAGKVLFCGDSHDNTWNHLLQNHYRDICDIKLMVAPHHGRDSGRDRTFLDHVRPTLTIFGRAKSKHLAYDAWRNRSLSYVTSNQSGSVVAYINPQGMHIYFSNESYARSVNSNTFYDHNLMAWYYHTI